MSRVKKLFLFLSILFIFIWLDQWTKNMAINELKGSFTKPYLGGLFKLIYAENRGAWGSLGSNWSPLLRSLFLIWTPSFILAYLAIWSVYTKKHKVVEIISYALIVSGGFGNLIDRIRHNYVVDFMYIGFGPIGTNIFNIADVVIMIGVGILLLLNYLEWKNKKEQLRISREG